MSWLITLWLVAAPLASDAIIDIEAHAPSVAAARALAREPLFIYDRRDSVVRAYASSETVALLRERGIEVVILNADYRARALSNATPTRDAAYVAIDALPARLEALAASESSATLERWGTSVQGRPLLALRVGAGRGHAVRVLGGHHGDERPSVDFVLTLASEYIDRLHSDSAFAAAAGEVVFMPVVNPDGVVAGTRHNVNNVDLNRNYNYEFKASEFGAGGHGFSQPETRAVALDNEYHRYAISLTYHTGAFNIGYPWNYVTGPQAAESTFAAIAARYKALVPDTTFWTTRGAAWYLSYGDTNDYSWGHFGGVDFTVEMSSPDKTPPASELQGLIDQQRDAAFDWLAQGLTTLHLKVTSADGLTLPAVISTATLHATANELDGRAEILATAGEGANVAYPGFATQSVSLSDGLEVVLQPLSGESWGTITPTTTGVQIVGGTQPVLGLMAHRPGADAITLACTNGDCVLPTLNEARPGAYDLTSDDGTHTWVRALWIADAAAETSVVAALDADNIAVSTWGNATTRFALASTGLVTLLSGASTTIAAPIGTRLVWTENGRLHSLVHAAEVVDPGPSNDVPVSPIPPVKRKGCAASSAGDCVGLGLALLLWAACKTPSTKRTRDDSRNPRHTSVVVEPESYPVVDARARSTSRVGRAGFSRRH